MIKINEVYIDRFKCFGNKLYLYPVKNGIHLSFDYNSKMYLGLEMFYIPRNHNYIQRISDNLINELLRKGILEYEE